LHAQPFRRVLFLELDDACAEAETNPSKVELIPFLEQIFPTAAKRFFDLVLGRTAPVHIWTEGRDVLVGQGRVCKRCYSERIDLQSLGDDRCFLHFLLLETRDLEDYFTPAQWYEHAIWRRMYAMRSAIPIHAVDASPISHQWEIHPRKSLGNIVPTLVVGRVLFSVPMETARSTCDLPSPRDHTRADL
jgi:hypothetical protein